MKIKAVCDLTGLTARTVRVYIDEQLIAPEFTENYLGRRSFEFSQSDIAALQNIATLRKYGFSIDEIRNILLNSQASIAIIENVKQRTQIQADEYRERLKALSRVESLKAYSVEELSEILLQGEAELELPVELPKRNAKRIIKSSVIFFVVWLPFVLVLGGIINDLTTYAYPKISIVNVILTLLTLIPSISILAITKFKPNIKRIVKRIILCLCIVAIPFSLIMPYGIVTRSETTDFRNYRDFDSDCLATRNKVFNEVFPTWPHYFENVKNEDGEWETVYLDAKYYYQFYAIIGGEKVEGKKKSVTTKEAPVVEEHVHKWKTTVNEEHPHKSVQTCDCGAKETVRNSNYVSDCEICNPVAEEHIHNWKTTVSDQHPHKSVQSCDCGEKETVRSSNYMSDCEICNPQEEEYEDVVWEDEYADEYDYGFTEDFYEDTTAYLDDSYFYKSATISVGIGQNYVRKQGTIIYMDAPAYTNAVGYTMVPLRAIAECLDGTDVERSVRLPSCRCGNRSLHRSFRQIHRLCR